MKSIKDIKAFVSEIVRVHGSIQMDSFHQTNVFHRKCGKTLHQNREYDVKNDDSDGGIEKSHILSLERLIDVAKLFGSQRQ